MWRRLCFIVLRSFSFVNLRLVVLILDFIRGFFRVWEPPPGLYDFGGGSPYLGFREISFSEIFGNGSIFEADGEPGLPEADGELGNAEPSLNAELGNAESGLDVELGNAEPGLDVESGLGESGFDFQLRVLTGTNATRIILSNDNSNC